MISLTFHPGRRRGAVAVMVSIAIVAIVGFGALAVDVGYLYNVRGDAQRAVDSAALAGASALAVSPAEAQARAIEFASLNDTMGGSIELAGSDVQLGSWDSDAKVFTQLYGDDLDFADSCRVTATLSSVPLLFAGVFGKTSTEVSASATAQFGTGQTWDLMIVQDISGSFTGALQLAKEADRALIECLKGHTDNESKVGFATYTGTGKLNVPLQSIASAFDQIINAINNLASCCWWWCGSKLQCKTGTNIAAGLDIAINELVNSSSDPGIGKAIVIVSDGKPQSTAWVPVPTDEDLRDMAVASADAAAAADISVFTVYYSGSSSTPVEDSAFLQNLIRGDGTYHETVDSAELTSVVWQVCASLPLMLVD